MISLFKNFCLIQDPRTGNRKEYPLDFILFCIITAIIAEAQSWYEIEKYCELYFKDLKKNYLKIMGQEVECKNAPSHDTLNRVFSLIDPTELQNAREELLNTLFGSNDIAHYILDGKTMRGVKKAKFDHEAHVVNAFTPDLQICVNEVYANDKKGELNALKELISKLRLVNSVITIDALGCQKTIAQTIIEKDGNYVLQLKDNQKKAKEEAVFVFEETDISKIEQHTETESSHGRVEERIYETILITPEMVENTDLSGWIGVKAIARCIKSSYNSKTKKTQESIRYYLCSIDDHLQISKFIRKHWSIENNLHYCLDVFLGHDDCSKVAGNSFKNIDILLKLVLFIYNRYREVKKCKLADARFYFLKSSPTKIYKSIL